MYYYRFFRQCFFVIPLILTGCKVGPDFTSPKAPATQSYTSLPVPEKTVGTSLNANAGKSQRLIAGRDIEADWWTIFHSSAINALVAEGIEHNQDLIAAKANLDEATDTLYAEIGGLLFPSVNLVGAADRAQTNPIAVGVPNTGAVTFNVYNTSFQTSYLLDIWGSSRRTIEAYSAQVDYAGYQMLGTYLTLTTNIVTTSVTIAALEAQINTTQKLIAEQRKILRITQQQLAAGGVNEENVLAQQTLLSQTESTLPPLQKSLSGEQHTLAVLLGKPTSEVMPLILALEKLVLPKDLPVSLPSEMIVQRPDIQASQALLHAASAQIGVATANLLPQLTITANYGWLAPAANNFFNNANQAWGIAANVLQPVFHGGQLWMQRKAAIEAFNQSRAQYKQTVLQAFKNVSDALRAVQYDAHEFKQQSAAESTARKTFILTAKQYAVGGQNYLAVLQAEEQYQQISLSRIKAQAMRYTDTAALYQALGGGWWHSDNMLEKSGKLEKKTV